MAKQWDFELDWADDEQETVAREDHERPTTVLETAQAAAAEVPVVEAPASEAPPAEAPALFDPRQTMLGLGVTPEQLAAAGAEDPNVTRPTPGGSRGGYPTSEELEKYNRPTRPMVDQSALAEVRRRVDAGLPAPLPPTAPEPAPIGQPEQAELDDDLDAATTKLEVVPDLRPRAASAPTSAPPASAAPASIPAPRMRSSVAPPASVPASVVPYAMPSRTTTRAVAVSAPAGRRSGSWAVLALAIVAGLFAGVWFGSPSEGELRVNVAAANGDDVVQARVYVAGDLRCRTVPCVVRGLEPGLETVRIEVDGQPEAILRTTEITAGQERGLSVRLPPAEIHGLRIGEMPGVTEVLVNGVSRGAPPLLIDDLEPGEHHVQLGGGEGFEPSHRTVEIERGTVVEIRDVKLKAVATEETED